ncbi:chitin synthase chs-2-like [Styela clava]
MEESQMGELIILLECNIQYVRCPSSYRLWKLAQKTPPSKIREIALNAAKGDQNENTNNTSDKKDWDFVTPSGVEEEKKSKGYLKFFKKVAKYVSTVIIFGIVWLGSIVTKSTLFVLGNAYTQDYSDSRCPYVKEGQVQQYYYPKYMVMLILMSCLCLPEVLTGLYSLWLFIKTSSPSSHQTTNTACRGAKQWLKTIPELLHAIGLTFYALKVIPNVDVILACPSFPLVALLPALVNFGSSFFCNTRKWVRILLGSFAFICLLFGFVAFTGYCLKNDQSNYIDEDLNIIYIILSLLLISSRYWECFVTVKDEDMAGENIDDQNVNAKNRESKPNAKQRYKIELCCSVLRLFTIVLLSFIIYFIIDENKAIVFEKTGRNPIRFKDYEKVDKKCSRIITSLWATGITHCASAFMTFFFGTLACKTLVQFWGYYLPLTLVTPSMFVMVTWISKTQTLMDSFGLTLIHPEINNFIGWKTTSHQGIQWDIVSIFLSGTLGLLLLTSHLLKGERDRLMKTEVLYAKPICGGPFITEALLLNRRKRVSRKPRKNDGENGFAGEMNNTVPHLFLCTTMWHEKKNEMLQLLKSVMRLNKEQKEMKGDDLFQFEVHIFFDEAMTVEGIEKTENTQESQKSLNSYVKELLNQIPLAANSIKANSGDCLLNGVCCTPYGGRLTFILPHNDGENEEKLNKLVIHLKDKLKIRNGKRWSQVMYMSYLLGYKKTAIRSYDSKNTYVLALDGDVDFKIKSVTRLLDRMKRDKKVGAACGRIHPIGSGPVVWFQKFEYAVGHWLQKTAEDVLGCVLCSPGCFSMFRAEALMDENVAHKYTTVAEGAKEKIQRDQGEDRWLCTLLLKAKYKIEYCASSHSYTFAPESFKDLYKQRRRWGPSTLANVFDILLDAKKAMKNDYISFGYIVYQILLMTASLLGPSTVILIIQGAFQYVFGMSPIGGLMAALLPVIAFVVICYTVENRNHQIVVAEVLTLVYALVMMAVLVGVIGQIVENIMNPTSLFMLAMSSIFIITGILHPMEVSCLIHGILYYICVPSAFIFMVVYCYCNMHDESWGTRDNKQANKEKLNTSKFLSNLNSSVEKMLTNLVGFIFIENHESVEQIYL